MFEASDFVLILSIFAIGYLFMVTYLLNSKLATMRASAADHRAYSDDLNRRIKQLHTDQGLLLDALRDTIERVDSMTPPQIPKEIREIISL